MTRVNPSYFKGPKRPVERVTWRDASAYCEKIGGRLPTADEWEYAARAGSTPNRYGKTEEIAWFSGNSQGQTHEVGTRKPNAWGLYDMFGNVWEWTSSDYYERTKGEPIPRNGRLAPVGVREMRGGAWYSDPMNVRVSIRNWFKPTDRDVFIGVRCAGDRTP